jgi:hypothetical protein
MSVYLGKDRQNSTDTGTRDRSLTRRVEGVGCNFTWIIFTLPQTYSVTYTQEVSIAMELSDKIIKDCCGALTIRH